MVNENWNDYDFVMAKVKENGRNLYYASEELKNNKNVIMQALSANYNAYNCLEFASYELRNDRDVILKAVQLYGDNLEFASDRLKNDKHIVIEAINHSANGCALRYASDEVRNDKKMVLDIMNEKRNSDILSYASDQLRDDKQFVSQVLQQYSDTLWKVSPRLKQDNELLEQAIASGDGPRVIPFEALSKESVMASLKAVDSNKNHFRSVMDGGAIVYSTDNEEQQKIKQEILDDDEIILESLKYDTFGLYKASERLKSDKSFMLRATSVNPMSLDFASDEVKNDKEFMLSLCNENCDALKYASDRLLQSRDFMKNAISINPQAVKYADAEMQRSLNGGRIFSNAIEKDPSVIQYIDTTILDESAYNQEACLQAIEKDDKAWKYIPESLSKQKSFMRQAIERNPQVFKHIEQDIAMDKNFAMTCIRNNPEAVKYLPRRLQYDDEFIKEAIIQRGEKVFSNLSPEQRNNEEIAKVAVSQNPSMFQYLSDRLKSDISIQKIAIDQDFNCLDMLNAEQRKNPVFAKQYQKWDTVEKFRFGATKLEDIDKKNFVDINFYNTIVVESKNKVLRQFDALTQGMQMSDRLEEKLQAQVEKKLKQLESKLEHQRKWALFKNGIQTKIDSIKEDFNRGFQAGKVASEIKHMEL